MKNNNIKQLKNDNKGSALIVCIIVLLFVSILATVVLYISGVNYRMKKNEYNTKKTFYTGEVILERMQSNLVIPVSEAMDNAYRKTNTQYAMLATEDARREYFYNTMYEELETILLTHYGMGDTVVNNASGTLPAADPEFAKYIMLNLTKMTPADVSGDNDHVDHDHIFTNDNESSSPIKNVTYMNYGSATAFMDAVLDKYPNIFAGNTDPTVPEYYILIFGELGKGNLEENYKQFVELDIWQDPATKTNLKDPGKCRIVFKNIIVVTVQNGYTSVISTDLAVQFPPIDWNDGANSDPTVAYDAYQLMYYVNWKND